MSRRNWIWSTCILGAGLVIQSSNTAWATAAEEKQPSEADQKWAATIEKLLVKGTTQFSTTSESRAELARALAGKLGWKVKVDKKEKTFVLNFEQSTASK